MTDYFCHPLWDVGPTGPGDVDPASLPLTPQLVADLGAWAARYDATLNLAVPQDSPGFASEADERDFNETGRRLAGRVAEELSGRYAVRYFDHETGQTVAVT